MNLKEFGYHVSLFAASVGNFYKAPMWHPDPDLHVEMVSIRTLYLRDIVIGCPWLYVCSCKYHWTPDTVMRHL